MIKAIPPRAGTWVESNTGQYLGIYMNSWNPLFYAGMHFPGLVDFLTGIFITQKKIARIMFSIGPSLKEITNSGVDFALFPVLKMHLPRWFFFDVTIMKSVEEFHTISCFQHTTPSDHVTKTIIYFDNQKTDITPDFMETIAEKYAYDEFYGSLIGNIENRWGCTFDDAYYFAETNVHAGMIQREITFPVGYDTCDIYRLESILREQNILSPLIDIVNPEENKQIFKKRTTLIERFLTNKETQESPQQEFKKLCLMLNTIQN